MLASSNDGFCLNSIGLPLDWCRTFPIKFMCASLRMCCRIDRGCWLWSWDFWALNVCRKVTRPRIYAMRPHSIKHRSRVSPRGHLSTPSSQLHYFVPTLFPRYCSQLAFICLMIFNLSRDSITRWLWLHCQSNSRHQKTRSKLDS